MNEEDKAEIDRLRHLADEFGDWMRDIGFLLDQLDHQAQEYDARVTGLLEANNALLTERRAAEGRVIHFQDATTYLLRINKRTLAQVVDLEEQLRNSRDQIEVLRADSKSAWEQAAHWMGIADHRLQTVTQYARQLTGSAKIVDLAKAWYRSIATLEKSRKAENNQRYTQAHLALKREIAMDELAVEGQKL